MSKLFSLSVLAAVFIGSINAGDVVITDKSFAITTINLEKPITDFPILGTPGVWDIKVLAWSQDENGNDVFSEQKKVLTRPVFVKKLDGVQEIIPIGVKKFEKGGVEDTYRVILTKRAVIVPGVLDNPVFQYSVPAFISPSTTNKSYEAICKDGVVTVKNTGNVHLKFTTKGGPQYVLAGKTKTINSDQSQLVDEGSKEQIKCL